MRNLLILIPFLIISACSPVEFSPPPATPETIKIVYPPTLDWIEPAVQECAQQIPSMIPLLEVGGSDSLLEADVYLLLGAPPEGSPGFATQLGQESLIMIANPAISPDSINLLAIRKSYTSLESSYQAWTYPEGYRVREIFQSAILEKPYSPDVMLAPSPEAMLQAIEDDELAIGFVPEASLKKNVQEITLPKEIQAKLDLPLIALTQEETQETMRIFLACLTEKATP